MGGHVCIYTFHVYLSVFSVCVSALCVRETFIVQWANCKKSWAAMEASHDALSLSSSRRSSLDDGVKEAEMNGRPTSKKTKETGPKTRREKGAERKKERKRYLE
jgi:hypothetical protein